jgi:hypothetical protein
VRIATQPFPEFLGARSSSNSIPQHHQQQQQDSDTLQQQQQQQAPDDITSVMVSNAVLLEGLAAKHGIPLVSLGSSSDPAHLGPKVGYTSMLPPLLTPFPTPPPPPSPHQDQMVIYITPYFVQSTAYCWCHSAQ